MSHLPPPQPGPVDKVLMAGYYDEAGLCHSIEVALNYDGISREDLGETIRALFYPGALPVPRTPAEATADTFRHHELGVTAVLPRMRIMTGGNGSRPSETIVVNDRDSAETS